MSSSPRREPMVVIPLALLALWGLAQLILVASALVAVPDPRLGRYFSPEILARHAEYLRPYRYKYWFDQLTGLLVVGIFLIGGLNARLHRSCERLSARLAPAGPGMRQRLGAVLARLWGDHSWSGATLFVAAYLAINRLLNIPEDVYFSWHRDRQQGISVESLPHFLGDEGKSFAISLLIWTCLAFGLYGLARRLPRWWLWLGLPCALGLLGAGMLDPLRVSVYHDMEKLPDGPVRQKVTEVLAKAHVEYEDVYVLKVNDVTRRVNAEIIGQGPTRRILLWDTFLTAMEPEEIANGVAHELGHLRDRSPGRLVLAAVLFLPALWLLSRFLRAMGRTGRFGFDGDHDVRSLPAVFLFWWMFVTLPDPVASWRARAEETRADDYALELLDQPAAFRSMMVKLGRVNLADLDPPLWRFLGHSHPRILDRLERAEEFARQKGRLLPEARPELFAVPELALPPQEKKNARAGP